MDYHTKLRKDLRILKQIKDYHPPPTNLVQKIPRTMILECHVTTDDHLI